MTKRIQLIIERSCNAATGQERQKYTSNAVKTQNKKQKSTKTCIEEYIPLDVSFNCCLTHRLRCD